MSNKKEQKATAEVHPESAVRPRGVTRPLEEHPSPYLWQGITWCCTFIALGIAISFGALYLPLELNPVDLNGKTYIVSGCDIGNVEFETAKIFLEMGSLRTVCMTRTIEIGQRLKELVAKEKYAEHFYVEEMNPRELSSVKAAAIRVHSNYQSIDGVVLNDGLASKSIKTTGDGYDEMFQVNYLSQFLFLRTLENNLADKSKVVFISSSAYFYSGQLSQKVHGEKPCRRQPAKATESETLWANYADTKLMQVLAASELAKRYKTKFRDKKITVNSVCPGIVRPLPDGQLIYSERLEPLFQKIARSPREGAIRGIMVMTKPSFQNVTGLFSPSYVYMPYNPYVTQNNKAWLYKHSCRILGIPE